MRISTSDRDSRSIRRHRFGAVTLTLSLGLGVVMVVSACDDPDGGDTSAVGPTSAGGPVEVTPEDEARRVESLSRLADSLGIADPPVVEPTRWIAGSEIATVMADCLTSEGFAASVGADGSMESSYTVDQESAYNLAVYVCTARYPTEPSYSRPPSDELLRAQYDYYVGTSMPCLEQLGYRLSSPPTFETFKENYGTDAQWSPYAELRTLGLDGSEFSEAQATCPQAPSGQ